MAECPYLAASASASLRDDLGELSVKALPPEAKREKGALQPAQVVDFHDNFR
jgi:hypothetical protein